MKQLPTCLALSADRAWIQRLKGYLDSIAALRPVDSVARLDALLERMKSAVLLVDLRAEETRKHLAEILKTWPDTAVLAFGNPMAEERHRAE